LKLSSRVPTLLVATFLVAFIVKVFFFSYIFSDYLVSDEVYYVTSAKYILHLLNLLPEFKPPVESTYRVENGTILINATVNERMYGINLLGGEYNWLNLEHPITVKLIYALIYLPTRSVVAIRIVQLAFSAVVLFLLFKHLVSKYGLKAVTPIVLVLLLDGTYYHLTYLAFLDTLMLDVLLLGVYFVLTGRRLLGAAMIAMTPLFKEVGLVFAFAAVLYFYLLDELRIVRVVLVASVLSVLAGYAPYLLFADPQQVLRSVGAAMGIADPFACKYLCMFTLRYRWSAFDFCSAFLWIWIAGIAALALKVRRGLAVEREELLPYFISLVTVLFFSMVQFVRAVYPFYFAPVVVLSIFPAKDLEEVIIGTGLAAFIRRRLQ